MKTIYSGGDHQKDNFCCEHKRLGINCKCKKRIFDKLRRGATKIKIFFKNHFPKRIWSTGQERHKGPKI